MLINHPSIKNAEQQTRSNTAKQPSKHQNTVAVDVLRQTTSYVSEDVEETEFLSTETISQAADKGAEDHTTAETGHEEDGDIVLVKSVRRVESVHVRTLQPVASHDAEVDKEVVLLEIFEINWTTVV